jgi:hypothetical protein
VTGQLACVCVTETPLKVFPGPFLIGSTAVTNGGLSRKE